MTPDRSTGLLTFRLRRLSNPGALIFSFIRHLHGWLVLTALIAIVITLMAAHWLHPRTPHNSFLPYEAILPGAPQEALADYDCEAHSNNAYDSNLTHLCSIVPPKESVYHRINVTVQHGHIEEVLFYSADLDYGELVERWGEPQSIERNLSTQRLTLMWDRGDYIIKAVVGQTPGSTVIRLVVLKQKQPLNQ